MLGVNNIENYLRLLTYRNNESAVVLVIGEFAPLKVVNKLTFITNYIL